MSDEDRNRIAKVFVALFACGAGLVLVMITLALALTLPSEAFP